MKTIKLVNGQEFTRVSKKEFATIILSEVNYAKEIGQYDAFCKVMYNTGLVVEDADKFTKTNIFRGVYDCGHDVLFCGELELLDTNTNQILSIENATDPDTLYTPVI